MALRIGGAKREAPKEEPLQEEAPVIEESMPEEDLMAELPETLEEEPMEEMGGGTLDPMVAVYRSPEQGPFMCGNCIHFTGQDSCDIVAGPIHAEGVCNLFESGATTHPEEPMPEGEPYPTEEPLPAEEPEAEVASEEGY